MSGTTQLKPVAIADAAPIDVSLATGIDSDCLPQVFLLVPFLHCHVTLQPGSTTALWNAIARQVDRGNAGVAVGTASAIACAKLTANPIIGALCGFAIGVSGNYAIDAIKNASAHQRCWKTTWDVFTVSPISNLRTYQDGGAFWAHPVIIAGDAFASWTRQDECAVNMTDATSIYHFAHWCDVGIYDRWGGSYPHPFRLNFDGTSCADWFCEPGAQHCDADSRSHRRQ
jgi:hypothetical protein